MNAVTKIPAPSPASNALMPTDIRGAMDLATMMARAKLVPKHLQGEVGDCLLVIEQASRWRMSPFAVAQCTSVIQGRLMFEGKLVAAAVLSSGLLSSRLDYDFDGDGASLAITVSATMVGEDKPRTIRCTLAEAKTTNGMWVKQPSQQLVYFGTRAWARRHAPEVMLGVYSPEEFDQPRESFAGTTINAEPLTNGQIIGDEIPSRVTDAEPKKKGPTINEWLADLERFFAEALAAENPKEAVDAILARDDVQKAEDRFTNGAKARLTQMIQDALAATRDPVADASTEDDGFPGDR